MKKLLLTIATVLSITALRTQDPTPVKPRLDDAICKDLIVSQLKQGKDPAVFHLDDFEITLVKTNIGKTESGQIVQYNLYHVVNLTNREVSFDVTVAMGIEIHKVI